MTELSVLPSPSENFFKEFSNILKEFLWESGNDKIKLETLYKDLDEGGIQLLDIRAFDVTLKMKWMKFLIEKESNISSILMSRHFTNLKKNCMANKCLGVRPKTYFKEI